MYNGNAREIKCNIVFGSTILVRHVPTMDNIGRGGNRDERHLRIFLIFWVLTHYYFSTTTRIQRWNTDTNTHIYIPVTSPLISPHSFFLFTYLFLLLSILLSLYRVLTVPSFFLFSFVLLPISSTFWFFYRLLSLMKRPVPSPVSIITSGGESDARAKRDENPDPRDR